MPTYAPFGPQQPPEWGMYQTAQGQFLFRDAQGNQVGNPFNSIGEANQAMLSVRQGGMWPKPAARQKSAVNAPVKQPEPFSYSGFTDAAIAAGRNFQFAPDSAQAEITPGPLDLGPQLNVPASPFAASGASAQPNPFAQAVQSQVLKKALKMTEGSVPKAGEAIPGATHTPGSGMDFGTIGAVGSTVLGMAPGGQEVNQWQMTKNIGQVALNPAVLAATGGFSALALPVTMAVDKIIGDKNIETARKGRVRNSEASWDAYAKADQTYKNGGYRQGRVGAFADGGPTIPPDHPLIRRANPSTPWAVDQPTVGGGRILRDPNRAELLNTGATEYKVGTDGIDVPSVVNGNLLSPEDAVTRYQLSGQYMEQEADPRANSRFYDQVNQLGLMRRYANGGPTDPPSGRPSLALSLDQAKKFEQAQALKQLNERPMATVQKTKPQGFVSKAIDIAANPVRSMEYLAKQGSVPNNIGRAPSTDGAPTELVRETAAAFNPASWLNYGKMSIQDAQRGDYRGAAMNFLGVIPEGFSLRGSLGAAPRVAPPVAPARSTPLPPGYKQSPYTAPVTSQEEGIKEMSKSFANIESLVDAALAARSRARLDLNPLNTSRYVANQIYAPDLGSAMVQGPSLGVEDIYRKNHKFGLTSSLDVEGPPLPDAKGTTNWVEKLPDHNRERVLASLMGGRGPVDEHSFRFASSSPWVPNKESLSWLEIGGHAASGYPNHEMRRVMTHNVGAQLYLGYGGLKPHISYSGDEMISRVDAKALDLSDHVPYKDDQTLGLGWKALDLGGATLGRASSHGFPKVTSRFASGGPTSASHHVIPIETVEAAKADARKAGLPELARRQISLDGEEHGGIIPGEGSGKEDNVLMRPAGSDPILVSGGEMLVNDDNFGRMALAAGMTKQQYAQAMYPNSPHANSVTPVMPHQPSPNLKYARLEAPSMPNIQRANEQFKAGSVKEPRTYDDGGPVDQQPDPSSRAKVPDQYKAAWEASLKKYNLSEYGDVLASMVVRESKWDPNALGPETGKGRAKGLFQFMPDTAVEMGMSDPFDPAANIDAGMRYFRRHLNMFGDPALAVAAHHAGAGNVRKAGNKIPDTADVNMRTVDYVNEIMSVRASSSANNPLDGKKVDKILPTLVQRPDATSTRMPNQMMMGLIDPSNFSAEIPESTPQQPDAMQRLNALHAAMFGQRPEYANGGPVKQYDKGGPQAESFIQGLWSQDDKRIKPDEIYRALGILQQYGGYDMGRGTVYHGPEIDRQYNDARSLVHGISEKGLTAMNRERGSHAGSVTEGKTYFQYSNPEKGVIRRVSKPREPLKTPSGTTSITTHPAGRTYMDIEGAPYYAPRPPVDHATTKPVIKTTGSVFIDSEPKDYFDLPAATDDGTGAGSSGSTADTATTRPTPAADADIPKMDWDKVLKDEQMGNLLQLPPILASGVYAALSKPTEIPPPAMRTAQRVDLKTDALAAQLDNQRKVGMATARQAMRGRQNPGAELGIAALDLPARVQNAAVVQQFINQGAEMNTRLSDQADRENTAAVNEWTRAKAMMEDQHRMRQGIAISQAATNAGRTLATNQMLRSNMAKTKNAQERNDYWMGQFLKTGTIPNFG